MAASKYKSSSFSHSLPSVQFHFSITKLPYLHSHKQFSLQHSLCLVRRSSYHIIYKMLFNTLATSSLLIASALAVANPKPMPYKLEKKTKLVKMSVHEIFGISGRQDSGYAPTQNFCNGPGDTCETACGADSVQCPSTDSGTHCFRPGAGQKCCPDGLGNACDEGYFCTSNSEGTWCCPDVSRTSVELSEFLLT